MKLNTLSAAVLAASSFAATSAMAGLNLNGIDTTRATDPVQLEITVAGATAMDNGFFNTFENLCTPNTLSVYTDRCTSSGDTSNNCGSSAPRQPGSSYAAYFCEMTPATVAGLSGPTNVLVRKRSAGGSGQGVQPVADAAIQTQMVLNATNCKVTSVADVYKCSNTVVENTVADAGISDVEPSMFYGPNITAGSTAISPTQLARLNAAPVSALVFGIPVTNALYAALQQAQGLNADLDSDGNFEGQSETATEQEILDNMPSLTREQVSALFKGSIVSWGNVFTNGVALTSVGGGIPAPADSRVTICRRVNGSGTQAQFNALFLNTPCSSLAEAPSTDNTPCSTITGGRGALPFCATSNHYRDLTGITAGQAIIHENSGSGNVDTCLDELNVGNRWALGIQSLEKKSPNFSFIKIDGVAPTLENVAKGKYWDWATTSMQWRNQTVNGVAAPTGNELAVLQTLRVAFAAPAVLADMNQTWAHSFGQSGYLSVNGPTRPFSNALPVMQYTRGASTCNIQKARGAIDL
jgi:hypothetical protein